ncbi:MAG: hypothetical protein ABIQ77_10840 [Anaerolineales bacterium]
MFDDPTVLILGAGASMPYGFPSGRSLLFNITEELQKGLRHIKAGMDPDQSPVTYQAVKWFKFSDERIDDFTKALSKMMHPSIDAFLEMYPEYMLIGKVAIAARLIPYEVPEVITYRRRDTLEWYEYFFNLIRSPNIIQQGNLSVVTFNYDRSFEYFLYYAFMNSYHMDSTQAIELMNQIPVLHIYGNLGAPKFLDKDGRDYEKHVSMESIQKCIDGLKIISEVEDTHPTFPQVHQTIDAARRVIFLGFGFHPVNVQRLNLRSTKYLRVFGTVCNMKDGEISRVRSTLDAYLNLDPILHDLDALNFLRATDYL